MRAAFPWRRYRLPRVRLGMHLAGTDPESASAREESIPVTSMDPRCCNSPTFTVNGHWEIRFGGRVISRLAGDKVASGITPSLLGPRRAGQRGVQGAALP
jgi:hypothetical protein